MKGFIKIILYSLLPISLIVLPAIALSLSEAEIVATEIVLPNGKVKAISCYNGKAGKAKVKRNGQLVFKDYKKSSRKQNKKYKKTGNDKSKKRARNLRKLSKLGDPTCQALLEVTPTPSPSPKEGTPTPTPNPQPTSYFNSDGSVNELGKIAFGIPETFEANVNDGAQIYGAYCSGCHSGGRGEQTSPNLAAFRVAVTGSPMLFSESDLSDQDLVDMLSYLGRFRTPFSDGL